MREPRSTWPALFWVEEGLIVQPLSPGKSPWLLNPTWASGAPWVETGRVDQPLSQGDIDIVRGLAEKVAEIAALPVQKETVKLWKDLNGLKPQRPMVMIDEIPWHEIAAVDDFLVVRSIDPFARSLEATLRQTLYAWKHMRVDMVVEPFVDISKVIRHDGFGITIGEETIRQGGEEGTVSSHSFSDRVPTEKEIDLLRAPNIALDVEKTAAVEAKAEACLDGILGVRMQGLLPWFALWDDIEMLRSTEAILYDLIDRPDFLHALSDRLTDVRLAELDTLEEMGLLGYDFNRVHCTGAHSNELPGYHNEVPEFDPDRATAKDNWTYGMSQLFVSTSDEMWADMEVENAKRFYSRFGLGYYGCCDPLHNRVGWLKDIPGIRKVSMSPWTNVPEGAAAIGTDYVFSRKPNPAIMAMDAFVPELAVKDFVEVLAATSEHGCPVEFTMKDVTTIRNEPERLSQWADIAMRMVERNS
jgi:hypothetical protein